MFNSLLRHTHRHARVIEEVAISLICVYKFHNFASLFFSNILGSTHWSIDWRIASCQRTLGETH